MSRYPRVAVLTSAAAALAWPIAVRPELVDAPSPNTGWTLARQIIGLTGSHLREAIGVLGWLDTPIPGSMFLLWTALLGLLAGAALVTGSQRRIVVAVLIALTTVAASWVLDFVQARDAGLFWQGRYGLPLLVGVVLQLGLAQRDAVVGHANVMRALLGGVWIVWNLSFFQAVRRWGVGESGSLLPWDWGTWSTPLPIELILVAHLVASAFLAQTLSHDLRRTPAPVAEADLSHHT